MKVSEQNTLDQRLVVVQRATFQKETTTTHQ
jgi:hypothetical protein